MEKIYVEKGTNKELNILGMYDLVFQDMVKCYLDNFEENELSLTESEIKEIAYQMIYKNEYIWEIINETIDIYIGNILNERVEENE